MKVKDLAEIPGDFFCMINTLGVGLLKVARKDPLKVKSFLNFWMEKIEMEVVDQEEYDYPKYVLRNSLCNILADTANYQDCLKQANFNIKEISSDLKGYKGNAKNDQPTKDKVKLMILAILYKIDCLAMLKEVGVYNSCKELITKAEDVMKKFDLEKDEPLVRAVQQKEVIIRELEKTSKANTDEIHSSSAGMNTNRSDQRKFIVKTKRLDTSISRNQPKIHHQKGRKSPDIDPRQSMEISPKYSDFNSIQKDKGNTAYRSPKNVFFATKTKGKDGGNLGQTSGFTNMVKERGMQRKSERSIKSILRKNTNEQNSNIKPAAESLKSELVNELNQAYKIAEFLKKEMTVLQSETEFMSTRGQQPSLFGTKKQNTKTSGIFGESESALAFDANDQDPINQEIRSAIKVLLQDKEEWTKQRQLIADKLDKLEKNMEKPTATNTKDTSNTHSIGGAKGIEFTLQNMPSSNMTRSDMIAAQNSRKSQTPTGNVGQKNVYLSVEQSKKTPLSVASEVTEHTKIFDSAYQGYNNALKFCLHNFDKPNSEGVEIRQIRQKLESAGTVYDIVYDMKAGTGKEDSCCQMKLYAENKSGTQASPLAEEMLTHEQLKYIFRKFNALEVLPSQYPVTSFVHLGYFMNFVLHKFVQVINFLNLGRARRRWNQSSLHDTKMSEKYSW